MRASGRKGMGIRSESFLESIVNEKDDLYRGDSDTHMITLLVEDVN